MPTPRISEEQYGQFSERGTHIAVFLLGYVLAVAKKHLHESSPSMKWGYPCISNSTSVALGAGSDALAEAGGDGASGFACILT